MVVQIVLFHAGCCFAQARFHAVVLDEVHGASETEPQVPTGRPFVAHVRFVSPLYIYVSQCFYRAAWRRPMQSKLTRDGSAAARAAAAAAASASAAASAAAS